MYRVSIELYKNTSGSLGEREMLWEHVPQALSSLAGISKQARAIVMQVLSEGAKSCGS